MGTEPVARSAGREQQTCIGKRVGIDDPLQDTKRNTKGSADRGESDVERRAVELYNEGGNARERNSLPY